jgi:hypothetical protein
MSADTTGSPQRRENRERGGGWTALLVTVLLSLIPIAVSAAEFSSAESKAPSPSDHVQYVCSAGPSAGQLCHVREDCALYCASGPNAGQGCSTNADCLKACSAGPNAGQVCESYLNCGKYCTGNLSTNGTACTTNSQCGAGGVCTQPSCNGFTCTRPGCFNPYG